MCGVAICSAPARSAIVRACLSTRWKARAESCRRWAAARGGAQQRLGGGIHFAGGAHLGGAHLGVDAHPLVAGETPRLPLARRQRPLAHRRRGFSFGLAGQLLVFHAGDLDEDVTAVEQEDGDALLVAADGAGRAEAGARRGAVVATRAPPRAGNNRRYGNYRLCRGTGSREGSASTMTLVESLDMFWGSHHTNRSTTYAPPRYADAYSPTYQLYLRIPTYRRDYARKLEFTVVAHCWSWLWLAITGER